jgi:predicted ribosomally synthesized peptide with SipW-like signal peptide
MPITATAIDISAGTAPQTITQSLTTNATVTGSAAYNNTISYSQGQIVNYNGLVYQATTSAGVAVDPLNYPAYWRQIGALTPFINGSVLYGSGGGNLTVTAGSVTGAIINLGSGSGNSLTVNGVAGAAANLTSVTGAIEEVGPSLARMQVLGTASLAGGGNGTLTINVNNGTLTDTNPNVERVNSVNIGANGVLEVAVDPAHGLNTQFITSGASTFAQGSQIGVTLLSIPTSLSQTYTVLQTTGAGTLSAGTFSNTALSNAPWLFNATASYEPAAAAGDPSAIELTVTRKTAAQIGFNPAEAAALDAVLAAAPANTVIQTALLSQNTASGLKSVYDQLLPSQGQGLFDSLDAAAQAIGSMTSTSPGPASRVAGTSLWLQEVNERVDRTGTSSEGSNSKLFGIVTGYELMGSGGGAAGVTLAYFNASEQDKALQIGAGVVASMVEAGAYYRRSVGHFIVSARAAIGYASFSDNRVFVTSTTINNSTTGAELAAHSSWDGLFYDGHFSSAYEQPLGRFYARPEVSVDFLQLDEGSHGDSGGGNAFDLNVASRNSNRLSGQAILVVGREWGHAAWLRTEFRGGYREILSGSVGDTVASFNGGNPFTLAPDNDKGGWMTAGFAIKGGSQYSYLALEGDIDFRAGEQRYDVRIAGRSIF